MNVAEEMELLREEIEEKGSISRWRAGVTPVALSRLLGEMGSIEGRQLAVKMDPSNFGIDLVPALFGSMPPGAIRVRSLSLRSLLLNDRGAEAVARELEANTTVTELDLCRAFIGTAGASALACALKANATLKSLDLSDNNVCEYGLDALAEALTANSSLERLAVGGIPYASGDGVLELMRNAVAHPSLTDLAVTRVELSQVSKLAEKLWETPALLRKLNVSCTIVGVEDTVLLVAGLANAPLLTHLNLSENEVGDEGAAELARLLSARSCALVDVDATFCKIGTAGVALVANALQVNRTLARLDLRWNVEDNYYGGDDDGAALGQALETNRTLSALGVDAYATPALAKALRVNCTLTVLQVASDAVSVEDLWEVLEVNRSLSVLDLSFAHVCFDEECVLALAAALACPQFALRALHLPIYSGLDFEDGDVFYDDEEPDPVGVLADALAANTSLTSFRSDFALYDEIERNRLMREEEAALPEFLCSAAGLDAVPWIAADVLTNIVAEYAGRRWSDLELALHAKTGSHFLPDLRAGRRYGPGRPLSCIEDLLAGLYE